MSRRKRNPIPKSAIKLATRKAGAKVVVKTGAKAVPFLGEAVMAADAVPVLFEGTRDVYSQAWRETRDAYSDARARRYRQAAGKTARMVGKAFVGQAKTLGRGAAAALASREAADAMMPRKRRNPRIRRNGPTLDRPSYPFAEKEAQYAAYTDAELKYALADAKQAYEQEEDLARAGHWLAKHGWYADDVHTIAAEIMRRRKAPRRNGRKR